MEIANREMFDLTPNTTSGSFRELQEELGIQAAIGDVLVHKNHTYSNGRSVALTFFHVPAYLGKLTNRIFESVIWVAPHQLPGYDFLEGDRDFIEALARGEWARLFRTDR